MNVRKYDKKGTDVPFKRYGFTTLQEYKESCVMYWSYFDTYQISPLSYAIPPIKKRDEDLWRKFYFSLFEGYVRVI